MKNFSATVCAAFFAAILFTAGCGGGESPGETYVVATDATLVPMSFIGADNGIIGFEPDLISALAKKAGVNLRVVNVEWAGLFGGLITKKFDMVISSVTILEERKARMAFSEPYLKSGLAVVVRKNQEGVNSFDDAKKNDFLFAAQVGTTAYFFLEEHPAVRKKAYEAYGHAVTDLINGKVDAVVGDGTGTLFYKNKRKPLFEKIKMIGEIIINEHYGIVLRKGDTALLAQVNSALQKILEDGTVARLHKKWELGKAAQVPE